MLGRLAKGSPWLTLLYSSLRKSLVFGRVMLWHHSPTKNLLIEAVHNIFATSSICLKMSAKKLFKLDHCFPNMRGEHANLKPVLTSTSGSGVNSSWGRREVFHIHLQGNVKESNPQMAQSLTIIAPQKSTNNSPITRSLLPPRDTHHPTPTPPRWCYQTDAMRSHWFSNHDRI